ncbi:MAG: NnrU family protein [Pseudomonadales bacterium]|nr:NnrU family protein [Pseudomonadales bacterium]
MELMLIAGILFLGTHLGISSTPLRAILVARLGERGYLGFYSLLAFLTLGLMIWLYGNLPRHTYFWLPDPEFYQLTKVVMPIASILLLGGFLVRNPTAVGMEGALGAAGAVDRMARGVNRITRHPLQWSIVLWAAVHLAANGDQVSVVFFGTFLVLGLAGGVLIDRKKAARLGADWAPFAAATSNVPFAAIIGGRNRLVPKELLLPIAVGLAGYGLLYWAHPWLAGVAIP